MKTVKVGTRLTLVLLLALTPVVAIYTYWSVARSTRTYIDDLKRETRASTRALVPAVENDLRVDERDQIYDVLRRMSRDGTLSALLNSEGKLWLAQPGFPRELAPGSAEFGLLDARGFAEFERSVGGRRWFCRLVPVSVAGHRTGYLLVSQDWTDISEDLRARSVGSVAAAVTRSTRTYIDDLKRETRASTRALVPALEYDIRDNEWDEIHDALQRMNRDGTTLSALFDTEGKLWNDQSGFPRELAPRPAEFDLSNAQGKAEFERTVGGRRWFCRLVLMSLAGHRMGYLLVSQDWTNISEDLRARSLGSVAAAMLMMALIAAIIPLAIRRYVSDPLSELSRRVTHLSDEDEADRGLAGDEVQLLTEEFRRLDQQLTRAGADLLEQHRRELRTRAQAAACRPPRHHRHARLRPRP